MPVNSQISDTVEDRLQRSRTVRYGHKIVRFYSHYHHDLTLLNPCPLPKRGPAILVCNHISGLDPIILQSVTDRLLTWMMAKEYYEMNALRWFYDRIGAISVERSGRDLAAMRSAFRALEEGRVIGLFPEGKISPTRDVLPFQTGVGLLALRTGAPVYPVFLDGSARGTGMLESFLFPQRVALAFGEALQFGGTDPKRPAAIEVTESIRSTVVALGRRVDSPVENLSKASEGLSFLEKRM